MIFPQTVQLVLSGSFTPACDLERMVNAGSLPHATAQAALQSMNPDPVISVSDEAQRERISFIFIAPEPGLFDVRTAQAAQSS